MISQKKVDGLNKIFGPGVFTTEETNCKRQTELDIAKGFSIIFMIWVHTMEIFSNGEGIANGIVENIFGSPFAAPVFMVCMGIGLRYSKKQSASNLAKRGIDLLIIGLLVNVFRYVLPLLIRYALTGEDFYLNTYNFLFGVDVLEFAGLAFLFFALAKKCSISDGWLVIIAVASSIVGEILKFKTTGNVYLDQWLGYIWGNYDCQTFFPFLNWLIFPVFGFVFGKYLRHCANKKSFYLKASIPCGIMGLLYVILGYAMGFGMYGENGYYYFLGPIDAFFVVLLVIGIFGFDYTLIKFAETAPFKALSDMSNNINTVYCIQWILIGGIGITFEDLFPENGLTFVPMTALACLIVILSGTIGHWYQKHKFLKNRFARIAVLLFLVIVMALSLYGQTKVDLYQWIKEYGDMWEPHH